MKRECRPCGAMRTAPCCPALCSAFTINADMRALRAQDEAVRERHRAEYRAKAARAEFDAERMRNRIK